MINFTIGPVQMDAETLEIGQHQIPYFRTAEFSALMKENEQMLCRLFDAPCDSKVVFMTGSGTASMEGGVMNCFTNDDRVLVVNDAFGFFITRLSACLFPYIRETHAYNPLGTIGSSTACVWHSRAALFTLFRAFLSSLFKSCIAGSGLCSGTEVSFESGALMV